MNAWTSVLVVNLTAVTFSSVTYYGRMTTSEVAFPSAVVTVNCCKRSHQRSHCWHCQLWKLQSPKIPRRLDGQYCYFRQIPHIPSFRHYYPATPSMCSSCLGPCLNVNLTNMTDAYLYRSRRYGLTKQTFDRLWLVLPHRIYLIRQKSQTIAFFMYYLALHRPPTPWYTYSHGRRQFKLSNYIYRVGQKSETSRTM